MAYILEIAYKEESGSCAYARKLDRWDGCIPSSSDTASLSESARTAMGMVSMAVSQAIVVVCCAVLCCAVLGMMTATDRAHIDCPSIGLDGISIGVTRVV